MTTSTFSGADAEENETSKSLGYQFALRKRTFKRGEVVVRQGDVGAERLRRKKWAVRTDSVWTRRKAQYCRRRRHVIACGGSLC